MAISFPAPRTSASTDAPPMSFVDVTDVESPAPDVTRRPFRRSRGREQRTVRCLDAIAAVGNDLVVVHSGRPPCPDRVVGLLDALDTPVDRGDDADDVTTGADDGKMRFERPDLAVDDTGDDSELSRTWQTLTHRGLRTVTVDAHAAGRPGTGSFFLVRRDAVIDHTPAPVVRSIRTPSWWAALLVVSAFVVVHVALITAGGSALTRAEARWSSAALLGTVDEFGGRAADGSSLWPALVRPLFGWAGESGLRVFSLVCAVVAIGCASRASSLLFGRWAARMTAGIIAIGFTVTGMAIRPTPEPFALTALSVALLGIALVESTSRKSWLLLSGLASTVAVVTSYPTVAFVLPLLAFLPGVHGWTGWIESRGFRLVALGGALAWFLPTRAQSVRFIVQERSSVDLVEVFFEAIVLVAVAVAVGTTIVRGVGSRVLRRRVIVLGSSLFAVPFAAAISNVPSGEGTRVGVALVLAGPAFGGAVAAQLTRLFTGEVVVPDPSQRPRPLAVDVRRSRLVDGRIRYPNRQVRLAATLVVLGALWYLPWAALHVDWSNWWIAVPFLVSNCVVVVTALLSGFNNRTRTVPLHVDVAAGHEPLVGVIVPTYAEPLHMVVATVRSVLDQDWPTDRLRIVVSDDAHDDAVRTRFEALALELPADVVRYHRPPRKGTPERRGESKAGNLNSALDLLVESGCEYVETRDADDLVGSSNFLRTTVSHLMMDPGLGFVQTVKETTTSIGDPFNNNEPFFYRGMMLARNTDHGVFPCGSGLVWRRRALHGIGDFPTWNLVEDLHSGVLAIRAGWRGLYVPIVGAYAQHSPEDVANVFKQRGTWALDTIRLFLFDRFRGLPWRARLHFVEQACFYLLSIPLLVLMVTPIFGLFFSRFPLVTDPTTYAVHFWGFALAVELMLLALAADQPAGSLWRSRLLWIGMAPVYATSAVRAFRYGARRKPVYKVTRKTDEHQIYVKILRVHWLLLTTTIVALLVAAVRDDLLLSLDLGSAYWAVVGVIGLGSFMRLSWFGVDVSAKAQQRLRARRGRRRTPTAPPSRAG